jgi:two-component system, OmpR family, response regulator
LAENKILVVEDDPTLLALLKYNLVKEGFQINTANDGLQGLDLARTSKPDLIILDLMLPRMDGLEVCRILRKETTTPIMMLTARAEEMDKVLGLELGADDYLTKPFSMRELVARVRALLRRTEVHADSLIHAGEIEIDLNRHKTTYRGVVVELTPKEFDLLVYLLRNRGQVFSREILLNKVWGYDYAGDTRTVDVHIRWLRQKIEAEPNHPVHLITVRGVGYKFED